MATRKPPRIHAEDRVGGGYVHLARVRSTTKARRGTGYNLAIQKNRRSRTGYWMTCGCFNWVYMTRKGYTQYECKHIKAFKKGKIAMRDLVWLTRTGWEYLNRKLKWAKARSA